MRIEPSTAPNPCQSAMTARGYGMFIHFGINTFNNKQWSDGKLAPTSYAPPVIDADSWVKTAYEAGMKYVILITKHHDGFCLWNTDTTEYSIKNSGNQTDVVLAVSEACKKYGIKLGLYYSLWDRNAKCYKNGEEYLKYMLTQLGELLANYGEIVELWLDGGWEKPNKKWGIDKLYDLVKKLQPMCAFSVNITIGKFNSKGFPKKKFFPENHNKGMPMKYFPSDFRLFDPKFPKAEDPKLFKYAGELYYLPFEATICIRDTGHNTGRWFWDEHYLSTPLTDIKNVAVKYSQLKRQGNNLVINLAPNKEGVFEPTDVEHIYKIGKALGVRK